MIRTLALGGLVAILAAPVLAQAPATYQPPRMLDGKPSLEGVWSNASVTDLQRPASIDKLVLSAAEARAVEDADPGVARIRNANEATDPNAGLLDGSDLAAGRGYNSFWVDPGVHIAMVKGEYRSSWIVDPPNGRIPFSMEGKKKAAALAIKREDFTGPETRPLGERCIAVGNRVGPPMVNGLYNNNYQIIQSRDNVVIYVEMIPHARVIRINGKHEKSDVAPLFGDTIGRWEGDTLVAETTNFHPLHAANAAPANLSRNGKVTERFSRVSADQVLYEFTVEDPEFYSQPWKGEMSLNARPDKMYEFACHEGNYSMDGVLRGARVQELASSAKKLKAKPVSKGAALKD